MPTKDTAKSRSDAADGEMPPARDGTGDRRESIIEFEHPFFGQFEDGHFLKSEHNDEMVFSITLAEQKAMLPIPGIKREFKIADDSPDGVMLAIVHNALDFVKFLRPGDPIPSELLTGEPSWEITERHQRLAQQRLTIQLVSWLTSEETPPADPDQMAQMVKDPEIKIKINNALGEAAEHMGLGRDNKERVLHLIESLADALAPIEALREKFDMVRGIGAKIRGLRKLYGNVSSVGEEADPIIRLMIRAVAAYQEIFDQVDAQSADIVAALENIDSQIQFVQAMRNDLYRKLMAWEELFQAWAPVEVARGGGIIGLLRLTHRFLAPRFMEVDEWTLLLQSGQLEKRDKVLKEWEKGEDKQPPKTFMEW